MINVNQQPTYEMRDLGNGRIGIYYNGLCKGVVRSPEEAKEWFALRKVDPPDLEKQHQMLSRALYRT